VTQGARTPDDTLSEIDSEGRNPSLVRQQGRLSRNDWQDPSRITTPQGVAEHVRDRATQHRGWRPAAHRSTSASSKLSERAEHLAHGTGCFGTTEPRTSARKRLRSRPSVSDSSLHCVRVRQCGRQSLGMRGREARSLFHFRCRKRREQGTTDSGNEPMSPWQHSKGCTRLRRESCERGSGIRLDSGSHRGLLVEGLAWVERPAWSKAPTFDRPPWATRNESTRAPHDAATIAVVVSGSALRIHRTDRTTGDAHRKVRSHPATEVNSGYRFKHRRLQIKRGSILSRARGATQ